MKVVQVILLKRSLASNKNFRRSCRAPRPTKIPAGWSLEFSMFIPCQLQHQGKTLMNTYTEQLPLFSTDSANEEWEILMHESFVNTKPENEIFPRKDVYQMVTDTIISQLEKGTIPWQQSWVNNAPKLQLPKNAVTRQKYRGINIPLLWSGASDNNFVSNEWASYRQWLLSKEYVRKGEKGCLIVYADTFDKEVDDELKKIPFLKYSIVFNRCQLASYQPEAIAAVDPINNVDKIEPIEELIANTFADIQHREGGACYIPSMDKIFMPPMHAFIKTAHCTASENYYSTLFHELTHWTGNGKRINRSLKGRFGDTAYAQEELIAELGAAFLGAEFGIASPEKTDHASYIAHWLKILKDNKKFIVSAASEASKAVDFMMELQP